MVTLIGPGGICLLMVIATVLAFAVFWFEMFPNPLSKQKEGKLVLFLMIFVLYLLGPMQETILAVDQPDLIMTDVSPNAGTVNAGATLLVSNTVKNQGVLSAGGFGIAFHLSTDAVYGGGDDVVISGARSVKSLAVGASDTATTSLKIPKTAAGTYYVCAMADSAGKVIENEETNNTFCSASQVTVPRPDLIMTDVSPNAGTVNAGATLLVSNTVENQGALSAGSFKIGYRLSINTFYGDGDDVVITTSGSVKSLAAGTSSTATTGLKIPKTAAGSYYVCAMADSAGKVIENEETNNTFCSASQVTVPRPDLIMTALSPNAGTVNAGTTLLVSNTVKNQGALSAGGFSITYRLSTNTVYGDGDDVVISGAQSVKSLAVGASDTATTGLKIPKTAAGSYYICAAADSANKVIETDEANNSRCTGSTVTVTGGTSNSGNNGTLLYSVDSDDGFILWHKIVVDEDGDAMALWDVANTMTDKSSVWASYYNHASGTWGQAQKITNDDVVIYFSLPEAKFDQNGNFVVANTGIKSSGFSTWWNRFDPATGWGTQRTLPDGREAFGVNTRGEIFSQRPSNKEVARYNTNTDILTPDFTTSINFGFGVGPTARFGNLNGDLLAARADFGITAADLVVSLYLYSPVSLWSAKFDTPVLTFQNTTGTIPLETAIARDSSGHIAVVVAGKYCVTTCNITTHWFIAAIYFDGAQWGNWKVLDSSTQVTGVSAPSVKIDDQGRALAFWSNSTDFLHPKLRAAAYSPGSGWGTATDLNTAGSLITSGPNYPGNYTPEDAFTMSGNGDAVVSWMDLEQTSGFRIRENRFHPATGWDGETLAHLFPIATTGGARTPKAQVNSTGKGFRTWIWLSVDPKTYPHTLISTDEVRVAPVNTP